MANNCNHMNDIHFDEDLNDISCSQFGNPLYECCEYSDDNCPDISTTSMDSDLLYAVPTVPTPKPIPRQRTTIRRTIETNANKDIVYTNVCNDLNENQSIDDFNDCEPKADELPNLIIELESMLSRMTTDSFYAVPNALKTPPDDSPPPIIYPKVKPRRSLSNTSSTSTSTSSSSLGSRPLPLPPKDIPPPKPPHLPPDIPPPPPPYTYSPPDVPPRTPISEHIVKDDDNLDMENRSVRSLRKLSEPFNRTQRMPIGIARSQTFQSERHYNRFKPIIMRNNVNGIHQKCGYLWKTGANRKEFLDRWCVLHKNDLNSDEALLAYYVDRKTTSAKGKIMLRDIAFIKGLETINSKTKLSNNSMDLSNFCYFEVGVNSSKGRVYLFAAKCLSDQKLWINAVSQALSWDRFALKDIIHCGYIRMKNGISGQWIINFVILNERQMTVTSKVFDEQNDNKNINSEDSDSNRSDIHYKIYDLRKVMSIGYASNHVINSCATVQESGQPICLTFTNKVLYLQSDYKTHTELWFQSFLKLWSVPKNNTLEDQYLTLENIPVAIDKCINFVSTYGTVTPNIYLQQNIQSPLVNSLVDGFHTNAWDIQLRIDLHSVHDITTALVLFLRSMSECILTEKLYHNWIKANEHENRNERIQKFKILLHLLPIVNYLTLKKLIAHIVCIIENSDKNHTCILNIAPVLCPAVLFLKCGDKLVDDRVSTFEGDSTGIDIITDFILSFSWLFDVTAQELEKERKIQKALELLKDAKQKEIAFNTNHKSVSDCEEFLIAVYIYNKEWGKCMNVRLTPNMTAQHLIEYCIEKAKLKERPEKLSVYEIVYDSQLERCLHYSDIVLGVTLSWLKWSQHYSHNNYLCIKQNHLLEQILPNIADQTPITIFSELKYADKMSKSYKKVLVEFIGAKLSLYKDDKAEKCLGQWNIEDLYWYSGADRKRSTNVNNNRLSITFFERDQSVVKSKDSPYFGRTICCNTQEEYHKWMSAMICAEYPNGFLIQNNRQTDLLD